MLVVSFVTWYEKIQVRARNGAFVSTMEEHALRACIIYVLGWLAPDTEVKLERASETSPVWCGHKYILRLNKLYIKLSR